MRFSCIGMGIQYQYQDWGIKYQDWIIQYQERVFSCQNARTKKQIFDFFRFRLLDLISVPFSS